MTRRIGEFELIARYFAPLAKGFGGARDLKSDNAFLAADARHDLVVKTDTIVAGVHFLANEKPELVGARADRKSTRLNSSHQIISYAVFCLKKKKKQPRNRHIQNTIHP